MTDLQPWQKPQPTGGAGTSFTSPLEGVDLFHYAHSYGVQQNPPQDTAAGIYAKRLLARLGLGSVASRANSGYWAQDVAGVAYGTSASKWVPSSGVVVIDVGQNDYRVNGLDAQGLLGFTNALRALLWLLMSSGRVEETDASITYPVGVWSANNQGTVSGGSNKFSTTNGAQWSAARTESGLVVIMIGKDGPNGTVRIDIDGVTEATQDLGNQCKTSDATASVNTAIAVPLLGLGAGAKTITGTNVGAAGSAINLDCLLTLATDPPPVVLMHQLHLDSYTQQGSDAAVDAYNAQIDALAAEFQALGKPVHAIDTNDGFDIATMLSSAKPRHLNARGDQHYADLLEDFLRTLDFSKGLNLGL